MKPKKYLLLTASYGNGHNSAKNAIERTLIEQGHIVESLDITTFFKIRGWKGSKKIVEMSEMYPNIWQAIIQLRDWKVSGGALSKIVTIFSQKEFNKYLEKYKPDDIICTFPVWPMFIENYLKKQEKKFSVSVILTDTLELSWWWYIGHAIVDNFFVIDSLTKEVFCKKFNHLGENVYVSFFPIEERYFLDKSEIYPEKILLLLSGMKNKFAHDVIERLLLDEKTKKIFIVRGRNKALFEDLKNAFSHPKVEFFEYLDIKANLKNIDILISKPGGAILSECIAQDVVLIAPNFIPGQEEGNITFMKKANVGIYEPNPEEILEYFQKTDFSLFLPYFKKVKNATSVRYILDKIDTETRKY